MSSQPSRWVYLILGYLSGSPHRESYYLHGGAFLVPQTPVDLLKRIAMNLRDFVLVFALIMIGNVPDSYDLFHGDGSLWRLVYKPFWFASACAVMVAVGISWPVGGKPTAKSVGLVVAALAVFVALQIANQNPGFFVRSYDGRKTHIDGMPGSEGVEFPITG